MIPVPPLFEFVVDHTCDGWSLVWIREHLREFMEKLKLRPVHQSALSRLIGEVEGFEPLNASFKLCHFDVIPFL